MTNKTPAKSLRELLLSPGLSFLMEAHDGMSARIAQNAGFEGIWASGLCISTSSGVRDANELSWGGLLGRIHEMSLCTDVPILVDGDSGHGNFNTARIFAKHAKQAGADGVCFEDKEFPKMNSFFGDDQRLAETHDFIAKLAASREAVGDDFVIVARTEGLVAGVGIEESVARAEAYRSAGADAIFIHSREADPGEIAEFAHRWEGRGPLVIAPTTYGDRVPADYFQHLGISAVIWANQSLRVAYRAMAEVTRHLFERQSLVDMPAMVGVDEIFRHYDYEEIGQTEQRLAKAGRRIARQPRRRAEERAAS